MLRRGKRLTILMATDLVIEKRIYAFWMVKVRGHLSRRGIEGHGAVANSLESLGSEHTRGGRSILNQ